MNSYNSKNQLPEIYKRSKSNRDPTLELFPIKHQSRVNLKETFAQIESVKKLLNVRLEKLKARKSILELQDDQYLSNPLNPYPEQNQYPYMQNPYQFQYNNIMNENSRRNNYQMPINHYDNNQMKSMMMNQIIPIHNKNPVYHHPIKGEKVDFSRLKYGQHI